MAYAAPNGRAFLDRALYLPEEEWALDEERRKEAGVPEEVDFAKKGELACRMLERAFEAGVPASWVTGDEVYGQSGKLRRWLEEQGKSYVLAVSRSHPLWSRSVQGVPVQRWVEEIVAEAPTEAWEKIEAGQGSKGPRLYEWARACLPYLTGRTVTRSGFWCAARWMIRRIWPTTGPTAPKRRHSRS